MRSLFLVCSIILSVATQAVAADSSRDDPAVRAAVRKSVNWLEADMQVWRNERSCAACHHGPMYLWSINVAKTKGYPVNEPLLREMTRWLLTADEPRIFPKADSKANGEKSAGNAADKMTTGMLGHKKLSQPTLYLTHAMNALPDDEPLKSVGWRKIIEHLAAAQMEDGSFMGRDAWRPIFNTPQILTRFAVTGLQDAKQYAWLPQAALNQRQSILAKADTYIASQVADETHQGLILRLLASTAATEQDTKSVDRADRTELIKRLSAWQRADGGWSQTDDQASDAFATGQTLYALKRAGVTANAPEIRRAIEFLIRTQQPDGTWRMTSRPNPEDGQPADNLNPITYAATAWATLGLTTAVPND